jgi:hypothetical protein
MRAAGLKAQMRLVTLAATAATAALAGCQQFNQQCSYPVADPGSVVFTLGQPLDLSLSAIAGKESAIGDAVPDGYLQGTSSGSNPPQIALEVVSAVHDTSLCSGSSSPTLAAGPVTASELRNVLPSGDPLVVEQITLNALFNILEHGAAGPTGQIDTTSGRWVEVSGLQYTVDCSKAAEVTTQLRTETVRTAEGQRVVSIQTGARTYTRADAAANTMVISVVLPESLAKGGDDFFDLRDAYSERGSAAWTATSVQAFDAVEHYLAALPATDGQVTLGVNKRITVMNCGAPQQ